MSGCDDPLPMATCPICGHRATIYAWASGNQFHTITQFAFESGRITVGHPQFVEGGPSGYGMDGCGHELSRNQVTELLRQEAS